MTTLTTTLFKDLIAIPERVHQGDFVLKLADGLEHARATVGDYVVTPQLNKCFDDALGFIRSAVASRSSKAAYLHGSFGSGKSHLFKDAENLRAQLGGDAFFAKLNDGKEGGGDGWGDLGLTRALARQLPRCPCCQRNL